MLQNPYFGLVSVVIFAWIILGLAFAFTAKGWFRRRRRMLLWFFATVALLLLLRLFTG